MAKISHMPSYSDVSFFNNKMATKGNRIRRDYIKVTYRLRNAKLSYSFCFYKLLTGREQWPQIAANKNERRRLAGQTSFGLTEPRGGASLLTRPTCLNQNYWRGPNQRRNGHRRGDETGWITGDDVLVDKHFLTLGVITSREPSRPAASQRTRGKRARSWRGAAFTQLWRDRGGTPLHILNRKWFNSRTRQKRSCACVATLWHERNL